MSNYLDYVQDDVPSGETGDLPSNDPSWSEKAAQVIELLKTLGPATRSEIRYLDSKKSRSKRIGRLLLDTLAWMSIKHQVINIDGRWHLAEHVLGKETSVKVTLPPNGGVTLAPNKPPIVTEKPTETKEAESAVNAEILVNPPDTWLSAIEAAQLLGCHPTHLKILTERGQLVRRAHGRKLGFYYRKDLVVKLIGSVARPNGYAKTGPKKAAALVPAKEASSKALAIIPPPPPRKLPMPKESSELTHAQLRKEGASLIKEEYRKKEEEKNWQYLLDSIDDVIRLTQDRADRKLQADTAMGGIAVAVEDLPHIIQRLKTLRGLT